MQLSKQQAHHVCVGTQYSFILVLELQAYVVSLMFELIAAGVAGLSVRLHAEDDDQAVPESVASGRWGRHWRRARICVQGAVARLAVRLHAEDDEQDVL